MSQNLDCKRELGQFMTKPSENIFELGIFREWMNMVPRGKIMEPFAGGKDIPKLVSDAGFHREWEFYDIDPQDPDTIQRDMIFDFPTDFESVAFITNNPWLAKNSATRRGVKFPETEYDDLYKASLDVLLQNFDYGACIVPESFITQNIFHYRIYAIISLTTEMFNDTECPSCLVLFMPNHHSSFGVFRMDKFIGKFSDLQKCIMTPEKNVEMTFNDPNGEIGLIGIDDTTGPTIRFVRGSEIEPSSIKNTSRSITRISVDLGAISSEDVIDLCNVILQKERTDTEDVFYTAFKGMRTDRKFRRRLDFKNVKRIISYAVEILNE